MEPQAEELEQDKTCWTFSGDEWVHMGEIFCAQLAVEQENTLAGINAKINFNTDSHKKHIKTFRLDKMALFIGLPYPFAI